MYGDQLVYESKEHRGYTCRVVHDPDPISPNDWDMFGTIYSNHRSYDFQKHKMDEIIEFDDEGHWHVNEDYIFVRIYIYDHSGITIWSSREPQRCGWDSGLFGLMAVHKDKAAKEYGDITNAENYEKVMERLESDVETWDMYCRGDVFGFEVLDENGDVTDSCWGFYGEDGAKEAMVEGISIINYEIDERERKEAIVAPFWID